MSWGVFQVEFPHRHPQNPIFAHNSQTKKCTTGNSATARRRRQVQFRRATTPPVSMSDSRVPPPVFALRQHMRRYVVVASRRDEHHAAPVVVTRIRGPSRDESRSCRWAVTAVGSSQLHHRQRLAHKLCVNTQLSVIGVRRGGLAIMGARGRCPKTAQGGRMEGS